MFKIFFPLRSLILCVNKLQNILHACSLRWSEKINYSHGSFEINGSSVTSPCVNGSFLSAAHQRSGPTHTAVSSLRPGPVPLPPYQLRTGNRHRCDGWCKWVRAVVSFLSNWIGRIHTSTSFIKPISYTLWIWAVSGCISQQHCNSLHPRAWNASSVSVPLAAFLQLRFFSHNAALSTDIAE